MVGAILAFSLGSTIVKKSGIPGPTMAFWRMLLTSVLWMTVLWVSERRFITLVEIRKALVPGVVFGLNITAFFTGVTKTSVANAEFIGALTPVILVPAGALLFKERINGRALWFGLDGWQEMSLRRWFFYDSSYASLGNPQWWAGGIRLVLIVIAVVLSCAFAALVPLRHTWWTHLGQYTMYVYLLHTFVLYPFRESGALRGLEPVWLWLPLVVLLSVGLAIVLASKPVRIVFRGLVEPRAAWLFAERALVSRRPATPGADSEPPARSTPQAAR